MRSCAWTASGGTSGPADPAVTGVARRYGIVVVTAALVVAVDQATKAFAVRAFAHRPVELIPGVLTLRLTYNTGAAFGVGRGHPELFLAVTLVVIAAILVAAARTRRPSLLAAFGLIAGGGLGNVVDRVLRTRDGRVVDFIDLHHWPVFNLADASIVVGVIVVIVTTWVAGRDAEAS